MHSNESQILLYLILILIAARAGGEIAVRFRQPAVLGEILAGVALGLIPAIRPAVDQQAIIFIAEIGVILLLFEVGLDSKFDEFKRTGAPAALVAIIGVILPLVIGFGSAILLGYSTNVALFLGGTLTATSIGITARVLSDLNRSKSEEAKIIIGAAVVDDILGILVLSVVVGVGSGIAVRLGGVLLSLGLAIAFLTLALVIGTRMAPFLVGFTRRMKGRGVLAVSAFIFGLLLAYLGSLVNLAAIVGAFAAGLVLASTDDRVKITEGIQPVVDIFAPVFFATVGMRVDLTYLNPTRSESQPFLLLALVLLFIAVPTKLLAGLGAAGRRADKWAIGIGMIPRGEVGLIFASLGRTVGIISEGIYGSIIFVVLATTIITPPLLKYSFSRSRRSGTPQKRLPHHRRD
jgi:Kef-type K+ transport system membrane component KefB